MIFTCIFCGQENCPEAKLYFGLRSTVGGEVIISSQPIINSNLYDLYKMAAAEESDWKWGNMTLMYSINTKFKLNSRCAVNILYTLPDMQEFKTTITFTFFKLCFLIKIGNCMVSNT